MPYFHFQHRKLYYDVIGDAHETVLLLPGNTASSVGYAKDVERLQSRYRLVLIDFLGTGRSERYEPDQYPGAAFWHAGAAQASALLQILGIQRVIAMGTSGGGLIALLMAAMFPSQIQAVAADSCVDQWPAADLIAMIGEREAMMQGKQPFWHAMHGADWRMVIAMDNHALLALAKEGGRMITEEVLSKIHCPVLLTGSRADDLIPHLAASQTWMASIIRDCKHHLATEGTHPWMWSRADDFYQVLETDFLTKVSPL